MTPFHPPPLGLPIRIPVPTHHLPPVPAAAAPLLPSPPCSLLAQACWVSEPQLRPSAATLVNVLHGMLLKASASEGRPLATSSLNRGGGPQGGRGPVSGDAPGPGTAPLAGAGGSGSGMGGALPPLGRAASFHTPAQVGFRV